ncbi:MAG: family 20 glycosylhydrolase [Bacteroidales bacterium]
MSKKTDKLLYGLVIPAVMFFLITGCSNRENSGELSVIPRVSHVETGSGYFKLDTTVRWSLVATGGNNPVEEGVASLLGSVGLRRAQPGEPAGFRLVLSDEDTLKPEGYRLEIGKRRIVLSAPTPSGWFYGLQTLLQMFPPEYSGRIEGNGVRLPVVVVTDQPKFSWRGMHLDVSRHFFPVSFVKKYIDLIAMHKMNRFHWHLTDDNGWRIEIKKYPLLTSVSAWRVDRENMNWREVTPPEPGEEPTYGGFYTQDEIREVVRYAAERNIVVIPEIEMPGHSSEVFAAYPELSCMGKKLYVQPGSYWPNIDIFCAGNEATFRFLEDVLTEVMDLFPSPWIHIGGDEANKTRWETCPKCQQVIQREGLADERELQSWFISRIGKFLEQHGRIMIGWDEILEGGIPGGAVVMSWRGFEGGIEAARANHQVIMSPVSHCYFDYYQANPKFEPEAIGGFTTLKMVYGFDPVPDELKGEEEKYVLGGQGNLWTEYVKTPEHAFYMVLPRMTALAEVLWSGPSVECWPGFRKRLNDRLLRFDQMGIPYSEGSQAVDIVTRKGHKGLEVAFETEQWQPVIRYTLDGLVPGPESKLYTKPFWIDSSVTVKAAIFSGDNMLEEPSEQQIILHQAIGARVQIRPNPGKRYNPGEGALTDGLVSPGTNFRDGSWLGIRDTLVTIRIDFGDDPVTAEQLIAGILHHPRAWITIPVHVKTTQITPEGSKWENSIDPEPPGGLQAQRSEIQIPLRPVPMKSLVVQWVNTTGRLLPGNGKDEIPWLFIDELIVQ